MTDNATSPSNNADLEAALEAALAGEREAIRAFLEAFLRGPLWAPARDQSVPLAGIASPQPGAPDLLVLDDGERLIVPLFSSEEGMRQWCAAGLKFRVLSGEQLTAIVPGGWWAVVNPAGEVEKELSPWELAELRRGTEAIPAVVEEIVSQDGSVPFELEAVGPEEYPALKEAIRAAAREQPAIAGCYLARERVVTPEGESAYVLVLGIDARIEREDQRRAIKAEFETLASGLQIGAEPVRAVVRGEYASELLFLIFEKFEPFYRGAAVSGANGTKLLETLLRAIGFKRADQ